MKKRTFLHAMTIFYVVMTFVIMAMLDKHWVLWPVFIISILAADRYHDLWQEEKKRMDNELYEYSNY